MSIILLHCSGVNTGSPVVFTTYDFQLEILESYIIENITIIPHQGMEKWDIDSIQVKNEEVYNSYLPFPGNNIIISDRVQGRGIEFINNLV